MEKPGAPISPERQSDEDTVVLTQELLRMKQQNTLFVHAVQINIDICVIGRTASFVCGSQNSC